MLSWLLPKNQTRTRPEIYIQKSDFVGRTVYLLNTCWALEDIWVKDADLAAVDICDEACSAIDEEDSFRVAEDDLRCWRLRSSEFRLK